MCSKWSPRLGHFTEKANIDCEVGTSIGWSELQLLQVFCTKQQSILRASYLVQTLEMRDLVGSIDEGHCG